ARPRRLAWQALQVTAGNQSRQTCPPCASWRATTTRADSCFSRSTTHAGREARSSTQRQLWLRWRRARRSRSAART
ncbi:hypothetical protein T484DRAFT_1922833, partial [Baffinella frigidus]